MPITRYPSSQCRICFDPVSVGLQYLTIAPGSAGPVLSWTCPFHKNPTTTRLWWRFSIKKTAQGTWTSYVAASGFNPLPKRTRIGIATETHRSQSCSPGDQPVMPARPGGLRAAAAHGSCSFWVAYTPPKSRRRLRKPFFLHVTRKPCHRTAISEFPQDGFARGQDLQCFVLQAS